MLYIKVCSVTSARRVLSLFKRRYLSLNSASVSRCLTEAEIRTIRVSAASSLLVREALESSIEAGF